ncbi:MAG: nitrite/sulfite reductase [Chloroflexi bacterium]|nr:nitrite/sulfite reductase [Chloroflexota bacterium]MDA1146356.1 nitrite/sulfite reductase [Chloroflexota bacterium]
MTTAERSTVSYTNDPGRVIPIIEEEFADFETEATAFLDGQREERQFIGFRLKQGVYGQRQADRQMMRVKLPFGGVTADQLDAFAVIAEDYAPLGKGHITTRENFQFHHIPLVRSVEALRLLGDAGLSTREACGNVVRNVTGDPWAGIRSDEPFDITPYAGAFIRYWVRNPLTQLLPRKFKVTFSGSDQDEALATIHDIGFIPKIQVIDGQQVKGFKLVTGGGLSTMAREGVVLYEFVPVSDFLRVSHAILRIFQAADELRKNLAKARMKFLVHRLGEEGWRARVDEELQGDWAKSDEFDPEKLLYVDDEQADAPGLDVTGTAVPDSDRAAFEAWASTSVRQQKQAGYVAIELRVPQGDLNPAQFRGLAEITRKYGASRARATQWQNLVLRWVPEQWAYDVYQALGALGLDGRGAREIEDMVSCPGTDSCKLGITSSMGLNRAIGEKLATLNVVDPLTRKIQLNASGCPNSCGMHHLGNIGFHGASIKAANNPDRQVPSYNVFVGGSRKDGASLRLGQILKLKIPAKRAPEVVERFIALYERERTAGEEFNDTLDRVGAKTFEDEIRDLSIAPDFAPTDIQEFIDWEREALYVLERGEGECAV